MRRALATLLALWSVPADAGAWLRAEGAGFLAVTAKVQDGAAAKSYSTFYAEYGANPDLTVGLDIGSDEMGDHKALAFVLMPLSREGLNVAFQLAAGTRAAGPALRPGLSLGKGLNWGTLGGWWNIDNNALITPEGTRLAIDATLGLNIWQETKLIGEVQHGGTLHNPDFLRLSGSLVWPVALNHQIEVGLSTSLKNTEAFGVKLGIWRDF